MAWSTDALIWRQVKLGATECELTTRTQTGLPIIRQLGFPVENLHFNLQLFRRKNLELFILRRIFRRNTVCSSVKKGLCEVTSKNTDVRESQGWRHQQGSASMKRFADLSLFSVSQIIAQVSQLFAFPLSAFSVL